MNLITQYGLCGLGLVLGFTGASLSETHLVRCMAEFPVAMSVIRMFTR